MFQVLHAGSTTTFDIQVTPDNKIKVNIPSSTHVSFGAPTALLTSGVLYYEFELDTESKNVATENPSKNIMPVSMKTLKKNWASKLSTTLKYQLDERDVVIAGFALEDGIKQSSANAALGLDYHAGCGDSAASWGLDGNRRVMSSDCHSADWPCAKWVSGDVIGLAANVDTGQIAVSINGNWSQKAACGVVFQDYKIKRGVYPCLSCACCGIDGSVSFTLRCSFKDFKYAPPDPDVWTRKRAVTLHDAIGWGKGAAEILEIMKGSPEAVKDRDEFEMLPIHCAARSKNEEVIAAVLEGYPDGAKEKDGLGRLPLHHILYSKKQNAAGRLIFNEGVTISGNFEKFLSFKEEAALEEGVIRSALEVCNEQANFRAQRSALAVIRNKINKSPWCSEATIATLLEKNTKAAQERDNDGKRPLHYACNNLIHLHDVPGAKPVLESLLKAYPASWRSALKNNNRMVVEVVLNVYPDAVKLKDERGKLPLQWFISEDKDELFEKNAVKTEVFSLLLKKTIQFGAVECLESLKDLPEHLSWVLERMLPWNDLFELVLHNDRPLYASLCLSNAYSRFYHQQSSVDLRLAGYADERASAMAQLSCAVARDLISRMQKWWTFKKYRKSGRNQDVTHSVEELRAKAKIMQIKDADDKIKELEEDTKIKNADDKDKADEGRVKELEKAEKALEAERARKEHLVKELDELTKSRDTKPANTAKIVLPSTRLKYSSSQHQNTEQLKVSQNAQPTTTTLTRAEVKISAELPRLGRLDSSQAWISHSSDLNPWMQMDTGQVTIIKGVVTRGRRDAAEWVTTYRIDASSDGETWTKVDNGQVFDGRTPCLMY